MRNPLHAGDIFYFTSKNDVPAYFYRLVDESGMVKNLCTGVYIQLEVVIHLHRSNTTNKGPYLLTTSTDYSKYNFEI